MDFSNPLVLEWTLALSGIPLVVVAAILCKAIRPRRAAERPQAALRFAGTKEKTRGRRAAEPA